MTATAHDNSFSASAPIAGLQCEGKEIRVGGEMMVSSKVTKSIDKTETIPSIQHSMRFV